MTTVTGTLAEFLLARIGEDEQAANAEWDWMIDRHGPDAWTTGEGKPIDKEWQYETDRDWSLHVSPRRVLAECEAKRRIVEAIKDATLDGRQQRMIGPFFEADDLLELLALPYADHPDYREEWRP